MEFRWKAIVRWPGARTARPERSRFSASLSATKQIIEAELRQLGARNIILQADCDASEIRNDGQFRANARMRSAGIIISFDSKHGPLSFACDRYVRWEDNYRAIAMTMKALRDVSRHGVVKAAEQYQGFKALPGPQQPVGASGVYEAATWLSSLVTGSGLEIPFSKIVASREYYEQARRKAAAVAHPDRHGGDRTLWDQLEGVLHVLDKAHRLK